ncbi:RagB/SusD family nutrient uptake outer membrane protein [Sphingobacterium bovistauri]|uniref:RagB/SusD family nutrient uptake outer membrane protein n=1 Tax=Sphingobacterium bovistauri TaxID=2781959 RepID=A0ABS7Z8K6_9SPHI|nr:RagB/SusD family nutrient uptake outer membrane protein [Sphingobacterium bovistauri]MCA5005024.1 RagB/SusD family nutrient uptake outer membrane protein [Sphingobacterium bovistauri]
MKKILIAFIIFGGFTLNGCTKFLDLPPKNQRAVTTLNDVKSVLSGYLDAFARTNTRPIVGPIPIVTEEHNMMFESYADNIDFVANLNRYIAPNNTKNEQFYANKFLFNDIATTDAIWNTHYQAIGFLNALIDQCDELVEADSEELRRVKGEMLVHRAYYIFKLQQYFAPMNKEELGIPLYLHTGKEVVGIRMMRKRSSEIYDVLTGDLKVALQYYKEVGPNSGYSRFFNDRYIQNLLAQVYWFKAESASKQNEDYQFAKEYALGAIEGVDGYIPKTTLEFQTVQKNRNPDYPAFYQESIAFGSVGPIYGSNLDYIGFSPNNLKVSTDFHSSFDATDIRLSAYFTGTNISSNWPDGLTPVQKYIRIHLFAPEEAYLILAEAYHRLGETDLALGVLNKFKSFRGASQKSGLSGQTLLDEIIKERRKEFFGDTDKRWLDLKRYANVTIDRRFTFFGKTYAVKVEPNSSYYALPIPLSELQENPDLIPNEGWNPIIF